jgi:prophage antirepressor-like protein
MPKKPTTPPPSDANLENLTENVINRSMDDAIESFAKLTQEDMQNEANQSKDLLNNLSEGDSRLVPFRKKQIRSVFHDNAWWFSVVDVVEAIAENGNRSRQYWSDLKKKLIREGYSELYDKIIQLKMLANDGKLRETDCVDTETLFRLIQSIPSKKAEPFRKWLAKVGYERILETQDPEIAIKRAIKTYELKGYTQEWINARIQTISSRKELTSEWKKRGIQPGMQYALLTDAISKETFDLKIKDHKNYKELKDHHNLRDHMSPLELALVMLGETTTAELARTQDAKGFKENEDAAKTGGKIAGVARQNIESKIKRSVITKDNYLQAHQKKSLTDKKGD